ncbi:MAG: hypothetical protein KIS67_05410 [Verrucomicrobiae bacterium]|nr:hypothetical protein [Verrucomicrobiae bacterium]
MKRLVQWLACLALLPAHVGAQTRDLPVSATNRTEVAIELADADLPSVLEQYSRLSGRNVLRPPTLPKVAITLRATATNELAGAALVEQALAEKNIAMISDGDKFVIVVPKAQAAKVQPHSAQLQKVSAQSDPAPLVPIGAVRFENATLPQVLHIYAGLLGRKLKDPDRVPAGSGLVHFVARTALTKEELLYALDTLLAWHHLRVTLVGEEHIRAVRLHEK